MVWFLCSWIAVRQYRVCRLPVMHVCCFSCFLLGLGIVFSVVYLSLVDIVHWVWMWCLLVPFPCFWPVPFAENVRIWLWWVLVHYLIVFLGSELCGMRCGSFRCEVMKFLINISGLSGDFSRMQEKILSRMERVCKSKIVSFINWFSFATVCICSVSVFTEVCRSWFVFWRETMLLWANSRLLCISLTSSCNETSRSSFWLMLAKRLTSISVVWRSSVSVEESFFFFERVWSVQEVHVVLAVVAVGDKSFQVR